MTATHWPTDTGADVPGTPERRAMEILAATPGQLTPLELQKTLRREAGILPAAAREAIRNLVLTGRLGYRSLHGRTVIGPNYLQPVRVAPRVILSPPGVTPHTDPGDVVVFLASGVSFGNGEHPSTRLAIRRLDHLLRQCDETFREMLDIGSGSGVLALAALRLGVARAMGLDTDPCALQEARANARLNDLACRLAFSGRPLEQLAGPYRLIVANLRPPTLRSLVPCIDRLAPPGAFLVMAGMRSAEAPAIRAVYASAGFDWRSQEEEEGWCALLLQRGVERRPLWRHQSLPTKAA